MPQGSEEQSSDSTAIVTNGHYYVVLNSAPDFDGYTLDDIGLEQMSSVLESSFAETGSPLSNLNTSPVHFGSVEAYRTTCRMGSSQENYPCVIFSYFLLSFDINGIRFFQNPLPPKELHFIHNPLTSQKSFF